MLTWDTPLTSVLTEKRRASSLKKFDLLTVGDALTYYPFRVSPPVEHVSLAHISSLNTPLAFAAKITHIQSIKASYGHASRLIVTVEEIESPSHRSAQLIFFSRRQTYIQWLSARLTSGKDVLISGVPSFYNNTLQFTHPQVQVVGSDITSLDEGFSALRHPTPVYHASARFSSEKIAESIHGLISLIENQEGGGTRCAPDIIPETIRKNMEIEERWNALVHIHQPATVEEFKKARKTLTFEEAFISQMALLQARSQAEKHEAFICHISQEKDALIQRSLVKELEEKLPFSLTEGQKEVIHTISKDLDSSKPMRRLLQGEVGSGKTIVALMALLQAVEAGYQAVFIAPTLVLAQQHAEKLQEYIHLLGSEAPPLYLLTGSLKLKERRILLSRIASGEPCIVVATHAAFSKHFQAPHLALVVIDEQQRFGVEQRADLDQKSEKMPHLLSMTATPIPRTAAMVWFGDLDLCELKGMPAGRKPVETFIVRESDSVLMSRMFAHCRKHIDQGEQTYVICPTIDSNEESCEDDKVNNSSQVIADKEKSSGLYGYGEYGEEDLQKGASDGEASLVLHSVHEIAQRLRTLPQFQGIEIVTLTGRDDTDQKNHAMEEFASGRAPLLVATTVVEVGVDVPSATCMVIFNAERFGLSQLHQLRGRVGRGNTKARCFLVTNVEEDSLAMNRLKVIQNNSNGKDIAYEDIKLRGAGDVLGDTQAGMKSSFKLLKVVEHHRMIEEARTYAQNLLDKDPTLEKEPALAGAILDFLRQNEKYLIKN